MDPESAVVRCTAKAVTYCDVMSLSAEYLSEELSTDEVFQEYVRTTNERQEERQRSIIARLKARSAPRSAIASAAGSSSSSLSSAEPGQSSALPNLPKPKTRFAAMLGQAMAAQMQENAQTAEAANQEGRNGGGGEDGGARDAGSSFMPASKASTLVAALSGAATSTSSPASASRGTADESYESDSSRDFKQFGGCTATRSSKASSAAGSNARGGTDLLQV